ncbi:hypothetical protein SISNIDRAFT_483177 [Sistotremastrum niveocremeum HHB9708]|uniref:Uncharacterized protein n=1 Tax=Sistotremastrum niveocremeum HHB9708 TaxID=1314777 RepID=A0A164X8X6_9AGAM|nr:hypothetical protein SISNIDRAFT_483177 [Sistotremastrum niveocremeum HHB9708]
MSKTSFFKHIRANTTRYFYLMSWVANFIFAFYLFSPPSREVDDDYVVPVEDTWYRGGADQILLHLPDPILQLVLRVFSTMLVSIGELSIELLKILSGPYYFQVEKFLSFSGDIWSGVITHHRVIIDCLLLTSSIYYATRYHLLSRRVCRHSPDEKIDTEQSGNMGPDATLTQTHDTEISSNASIPESDAGSEGSASHNDSSARHIHIEVRSLKARLVVLESLIWLLSLAHRPSLAVQRDSESLPRTGEQKRGPPPTQSQTLGTESGRPDASVTPPAATVESDGNSQELCTFSSTDPETISDEATQPTMSDEAEF